MAHKPTVIGLTGPLASGKTALAAFICENFEATSINADDVVHDLQRPGTLVTARIAKTFGQNILNANQAVDRGALSTHLLQHPEQLAELNSIVHPAVRAEVNQRLMGITVPHVILDVPLLFSSTLQELCDKTMTTMCPPELCWERAQDRPNMSRAKFDMLNSKQLPDDELIAKADLVIDTTKPHEELLPILTDFLS